MFRRTGAVLLGRMPDIADFWLAWVLLKRPFASIGCMRSYVCALCKFSDSVFLKAQLNKNTDQITEILGVTIIYSVGFGLLERLKKRLNVTLIERRPRNCGVCWTFKSSGPPNVHVVNNGFDGHVRVRDARRRRTKFRLLHAGTCYTSVDKLTVALKRLSTSLDDVHKDWEIYFVGDVFFDLTKLISDLNLHKKCSSEEPRRT